MKRSLPDTLALVALLAAALVAALVVTATFVEGALSVWRMLWGM